MNPDSLPKKGVISPIPCMDLDEIAANEKEYRIGLASKLGIKYDPADVLRFKKCVEITVGDKAKIVWKKSVLDKIK